MNYKIVPLMPEHDSMLEKVIRDCLLEYHANHEGTVWVDPLLPALSKEYAGDPDKITYWVAVDEENKVIGGVGIGPIDDKICELQKLYTDIRYRGSGLGKDLLDMALNFAKKHYEACYLETLESMTRAISFYKKNGFVKANRIGDTGHDKCDQCYILKF